jgi:uncharacterized protein YggT (Ycf19 family)
MASIIYFVFGFIVFLVLFRFIFRLLGANPSNAFVAFIYSLSTPLVAPFAGIFGQPIIIPDGIAGGTFEWASLVALVVYGLIGSIASRAFGPSHRRI